MNQKKNVVISDIHMGINTSTNWYQKTIHEPYLAYILQWVIDHKEEVDELIILGDLFDFWTYAPHVKPPTSAEIIEANPNILGADGLINGVLEALDGNVSYLHGNHDITTTQEDLNQIGSCQYKVILRDDIYVKDNVVYTHGHLFTMFNAPDISSNQKLPVGHFVTRSISYMLENKHESAANEPGFGAKNMGYGGIEGIIKDGIEGIKLRSIADELLEDIQNASGIQDDTEIVLERDFGTITFGEAKSIYKDLFSKWEEKYKQQEGTIRGLMYAYKAAYADYDGSYLGWFAQQLAFEHDADLVVMGHTHIPKSGLEKDIANYMNSGFECVPSPDMKSQRMTFSIVTTEEEKTASGEVLAVTQEGNDYVANNDNPPKAMVYGKDSHDYSCYITVDNQSNEEYEIVANSIKNNDGYFATLPPNTISANSVTKFWIQDSPGLEGSDGEVKYKGKVSGKEIKLTFQCPTNKLPIVGSSNDCSGTNEFYTKSESVHNEWKHNEIEKGDNPFFVKFIL